MGGPIWTPMVRSLCALAFAVICDALIFPTHVIDTHVHNADLSVLNYTFTSSFPDLARNWSIEDFAAATNEARSSVPGRFVAILMELEKRNNSATAGLLEAAMFQHTTQRSAMATGFVASAELESGAQATREYIQQLKQQYPAVRGIREGLWTRSREFFRLPQFIAGVRALAEERMVFDLLVYPYQLDWVEELVRAAPQVKFNLNHLGYPQITNNSGYNSWASSMTKLAQHPNCFVKLSGLPQTYGQCGWSPEAFAPYIKHTLAVFGANRTNYAGNWFVLNEAKWCGNYTGMFTAVVTTLDQLEVSASDV